MNWQQHARKILLFEECGTLGDKIPERYLTVYNDSRGLPTVGLGSLISGLPSPHNKLRVGNKITEQQAEQFYLWEIEKKVKLVVDKLKMNDTAKGAAAAFMYHHGTAIPTTISFFNTFSTTGTLQKFQNFIWDLWDNKNKYGDRNSLKARNVRTIYYMFTGVVLTQRYGNNVPLSTVEAFKNKYSKVITEGETATVTAVVKKKNKLWQWLINPKRKLLIYFLLVLSLSFIVYLTTKKPKKYARTNY